MKLPDPFYIGDSVYVRMVDGMIELTTNNGHPDDPRNRIYLEGEVWMALKAYVGSVEKVILTQEKLDSGT